MVDKTTLVILLNNINHNVIKRIERYWFLELRVRRVK